MKLKWIVTVILLQSLSFSFPVPIFNVEELVTKSDLVVFGRLQVTTSEPVEVERNGQKVSGMSYSARITPKRLLLGGSLGQSPDFEVRWSEPNDTRQSLHPSTPSDGDRLYFLRKEKTSFTWTSDFYHDASAELIVTDSPVDENRARAVAEAIQMMCAFAENTANQENERLETLHRFMVVPKGKAVHEMAERLTNDPSLRIRDTALFITLRYRDRRFVPLATERVRLASLAESRDDVSNLLLALSQEFKEESMPAFQYALEGPNSRLQNQAAFAARYTQSTRVIPLLLKLVSSADHEIAWNAMHSLGELTHHMDWRPMSQDPGEFQRCIALWQNYAREQLID
jgi:hypothetical protein